MCTSSAFGSDIPAVGPALTSLSAGCEMLIPLLRDLLVGREGDLAAFLLPVGSPQTQVGPEGPCLTEASGIPQRKSEAWR